MKWQNARRQIPEAIARSERVAPGPGITAGVMVAIGILIGATVFGQFDSGDAAALLILDVVSGVLSCALLPLLLRRPVAGAIALAVLAAISPAATPPATLGTLHVAQRRDLPTAISLAVFGAATQIVRGLWRPIAGLAFGWWVLLVILAEAALLGWGALRRARFALIGQLNERAERAEAEQARRVAEARMHERTRIAREMHDVLAHRLSLLATYAGAIEYRPDAPPERLANAAAIVRAGVHQALDELREVIAVLRTDDDDRNHDSERPQPGLSDLPALLAESRAAGVDVQFDDRVDPAATPPKLIARTAYRVVQESLTNARKHAPGLPAIVTITGKPGDALDVEIRNPLATAATINATGSGTGLIGLTERVTLAGGRLDHGKTTEGGFTVHARLPWPA